MQFKLLSIIGIILYSASTHAIESFTKFWGLTTINGQYHSWTYMLEPQLRLIHQPDAYEQTLVNMGVAQTVLPNLQLWIGQTYSNFAAQNNIAEDISGNDLNEYRIWQQILWTVPEKNLIFKARLEERYSFENNPWSIRFRERSYWTVPLTDYYSVVLSDEFFVNLNQVAWVVTKTFDQNRFFAGILKKFSDHTSVSLSYLNQYLSRTPIEVNHGVVLNIYYTIPNVS